MAYKGSYGPWPGTSEMSLPSASPFPFLETLPFLNKLSASTSHSDNSLSLDKRTQKLQMVSPILRSVPKQYAWPDDFIG